MRRTARQKFLALRAHGNLRILPATGSALPFSPLTSIATPLRILSLNCSRFTTAGVSKFLASPSARTTAATCARA